MFKNNGFSSRLNKVVDVSDEALRTYGTFFQNQVEKKALGNK